MDRVDTLIAQLGVAPPNVDLARALITQAVELGGTDEEILASGRMTELGPLLVDLAMRPPGETLPLDTFAERSGLDPEFVRRVWSAFGLPSAGRVPLSVTPDAATAVHVLAFMAQGFGEDVAIGIARVIGSATAGLADALANTTRIGAEVPRRETGMPYEELTAEMTELVQELLPTFLDAVNAVFRRHLVLVSYQSWKTDELRVAVTNTRTVGFVDLVGSTEVLRSQSVAELAASVDRFEQLVWDVVSRAGGRVVKLIGDEAMFVVDDPARGCDVARELVASSPQPVRVGLAHGEIVAFHGDRYGPTVNLAARLVAAAAPGTIVVSDSVRDAVVGRVDLEPIDLGPLRGFPDITGAFLVAPS